MRKEKISQAVEAILDEMDWKREARQKYAERFFRKKVNIDEENHYDDDDHEWPPTLCIINKW